MSLIGKEISDFSAQAFQNNSFKTVNREDLRGKWSVFFFYPADFTFVCPTELEDLENNYAAFQKADCEIYSVSCDTTTPRRSRRSPIPCSLTRPRHSRATLRS